MSEPSPGSVSKPSTELGSVRWYGAILAIVAAAVALRLFEASRTHLWFDELVTLWSARLPVGRMLETLAKDIHPPLHNLIVHGWRAIGGEGDLWLRSSSILFGAVLVVSVALMGRSMFGARVGLLGALLLALHRTQAHLTTELRYPSLLWLCLGVCMWTGWEWAERGRTRYAVGLVLATAAALYTHYLSGFVIAWLGLWGLVRLRKEPRRLWGWVGLFAAAGALFLPQLGTLLTQIQRSGQHWNDPPGPVALWEMLRKFCWSQAWVVPFAAPLTLLPLTKPDLRRQAVFLLVMSLGPILSCYLLSRLDLPLFLDRYMMYAVPAWLLLISAGVLGLRSRALRIGLLVLFLAADVRSLWYSKPFEESIDQGKLAEYLRTHAAPDDTILSMDSHTFFFLKTYLPDHGHHRLLWLDRSIPYYEGAPLMDPSWRVGSEALRDSLGRPRRWWAIRTSHGGVDVREANIEVGRLAGSPLAEWGRVQLWRSMADSIAR